MNYLSHIIVDKIYHLRSLFVFVLRIFVFKFYFSTAENRQKNRILWQLIKIRLEWTSQSNGSIGRPLGFVIDRLNASASLYRIVPCLSWSVNQHHLKNYEFYATNNFVPRRLSVGFCRGARVEGNMSRVEGWESRVEGNILNKVNKKNVNNMK